MLTLIASCSLQAITLGNDRWRSWQTMTAHTVFYHTARCIALNVCQSWTAGCPARSPQKQVVSLCSNLLQRCASAVCGPLLPTCYSCCLQEANADWEGHVVEERAMSPAWLLSAAAFCQERLQLTWQLSSQRTRRPQNSCCRECVKGV